MDVLARQAYLCLAAALMANFPMCRSIHLHAYIGRMQKPVRVIQPYDALDQPIATNLLNATKASLLMLPESFSDFELYTMIASISYRGDFRMTFGAENPRKVKNIVSASLPQFHQLYAKTLPLLSSNLSPVTADQSR